MPVEGRVAIKACTTVNISFEKCQPFFKDPSVFKYLQDLIEKIDFLYHKGNIRVLSYLSKLPGPVSDRQVISVNTYHQEGTKIIVGDRSVNYKADLYKNSVLGHIYVAGLIVEKVDENLTKVTVISDVDPKGYIPGFVSNALASLRAHILDNVEQKIIAYKG